MCGKGFILLVEFLSSCRWLDELIVGWPLFLAFPIPFYQIIKSLVFFLKYFSHPYIKFQTRDFWIPSTFLSEKDSLVPNLEYYIHHLLASGLPQSNYCPTIDYELPAHIEGFDKLNSPSIFPSFDQRQYS